MVLMAGLGISTALLVTWVPGGEVAFFWLVCERLRAFQQPWRLFTSGLLTDPEHWSHLLFSLVGLYFLGAPLERRWGSWRFARFIAIGILLGNLTVLAVAALVPADAQARFRPDLMFGLRRRPSTAIAVRLVAATLQIPPSISFWSCRSAAGRSSGSPSASACWISSIPRGFVRGSSLRSGASSRGSSSEARLPWHANRLAAATARVSPAKRLEPARE